MHASVLLHAAVAQISVCNASAMACRQAAAGQLEPIASNAFDDALPEMEAGLQGVGGGGGG